MKTDQLIDYITELQSLAQAGLHYGRDRFDLERYQRIREIATEMMAAKTDLPLDQVHDLFASGDGYQTPKVDTRAAIIKDGQILLVQEANELWSLPGGWCDFNLSPVDNTVKEAREESGRDIEVTRVVAIHDRNHHNPGPTPYPFNIVKIFYLCRDLGGQFQPNSETLQARYFAPDQLPELDTRKNTYDQVQLCFQAATSECWETRYE